MEQCFLASRRVCSDVLTVSFGRFESNKFSDLETKRKVALVLF